MKKCDDNSILKKATELKGDQSESFSDLSIFRKQFEDYQRAKGNIDADQRAVARPYHEALAQHKNIEGD